MSERSDVSPGLTGNHISAMVPLLASCFGAVWLKYSRGHDRDKTLVMICLVFIAICLMYGCAGAMVILQDAPTNAGLAAGIVNGVSSGLTAAAIGVFGAFASECTCQQPRLFVGAILILIFIMAIAVYGLIVTLVITSTASATKVDMSPDSALWFASVDTLANLGALVGSVASGVSIMDVGVESPHLVMRCMIPVVFNGITGIYGLLNSVIDASQVSWPPKGNDAIAGVLYLTSGLGLAFTGYRGVRSLPQNPNAFTGMVLGLMTCQSVGFAGLVIALVKHSAQQQPPVEVSPLAPIKGVVLDFVQTTDPMLLAVGAVFMVVLLILL